MVVKVTLDRAIVGHPAATEHDHGALGALPWRSAEDLEGLATRVKAHAAAGVPEPQEFLQVLRAKGDVAVESVEERRRGIDPRAAAVRSRAVDVAEDLHEQRSEPGIKVHLGHDPGGQARRGAVEAQHVEDIQQKILATLQRKSREEDLRVGSVAETSLEDLGQAVQSRPSGAVRLLPLPVAVGRLRDDIVGRQPGADPRAHHAASLRLILDGPDVAREEDAGRLARRVDGGELVPHAAHDMGCRVAPHGQAGLDFGLPSRRQRDMAREQPLGLDLMSLGDVRLRVVAQQDAVGVVAGMEGEAGRLRRAVDRPLEAGLDPMNQHPDVVGMRMGQEKPLQLGRLASGREVVGVGRLIRCLAPMGGTAVDGVDAPRGSQPEEGRRSRDFIQRSMELELDRHDGMLGRAGGARPIASDEDIGQGHLMTVFKIA